MHKLVATAVALASVFAALPSHAQSAPPAAAAAPETPTDAAIRTWVENHPEAIAKSLDVYLKRLQKEQETAASQQLVSLLPEMLSAGDPPAVGNPQGKVEMVYFLDAACTFCRKMTPHLKAIEAANPDLRVVQRWVAILGPASQQAALVAQVVHAEYADGYEQFYDKLMSRTEQLTPEVVDEVLFDVFGSAKADEIKVKATMGPSFDAAAATVRANTGLVEKAKIEGTPFMMVVGAGAEGVFRGYVPDEVLQGAVKAARTASAEPAPAN